MIPSPLWCLTGRVSARRLPDPSDPALVERFLRSPCPRPPLPQGLRPAFVARVVGQELGWATAAGPAHPLPEHGRLVGVVSGEGHEEDPDVVRLRLLHPVVRQAAENGPPAL